MYLLMDWLHLQGVQFILWLQHYYEPHAESMLFLSHLGNPRNAFLVYFPLAYFLHRQTGIKVLWAGTIAEWLNAVLKWLLFGQRPYWWVHTTTLYGEDAPHLNQFRLTCESGPGSPSGHAMVTAAVWYLMLRSLCQRKLARMEKGKLWMGTVWICFLIMMCLVSFSRCFIAAHFPHQVVFGTIVGAILGETCLRLPCSQTSLGFYSIASAVILVTGVGFYWVVEALGYDPMWTISLAKQWCAKAEWVYLDTTLFFAVTRDASVFLGTGLSLWYMQRKHSGHQESTSSDSESPSLLNIFMIVISVIFTRALEYIHIPQHTPLLFYFLAYLRYLIVPVSVIVGVPLIFSALFKIDITGKVKDR